MIQQNQKTIDLWVFLTTGSRMFERIMHKKMSIFFKTSLSPYMCGYRKGFSTQQALMKLTETWKTSN